MDGARQQLDRRDLVSILQFSVLSFVILPILPNQNYGPYAAFNPHQAWMMVVLISGVTAALLAARAGRPPGEVLEELVRTAAEAEGW